MKTHRLVLVSLALGLGALGALGVACSPSTTPFNPDDGGSDSGLDSTKDAPTGDGGKTDGGQDGSTTTCTSPVNTACDIVAQNCPPTEECVVIDDKGNSSTKCMPAGTGAIPKGGVCTPSGSNPCVKGTTCVSGRCAPACCQGGDSLCGNSIPEGFTGQCNINLVDTNNKPLYFACTYNAACKPFGVQPCPQDYTCLVKDVSGTATCSSIFQPPGKAEGVACSVANDCADGMMCLSTGDAGFTCKYTCYKGGGPYFDGGTVDAGPGKGGCKSPKTCQGGVTGLPSWLGLCQ